jgi:hypothetical protein
MNLYPIVEIVRLEENETLGTIGILRIQKRVFCATLEPEDKLNAQNVSSIPAQQYICRRHSSPKFGQTFMVTNVPGRSAILFHPGNLVTDTQGCIVLGELAPDFAGTKPTVRNSAATFREFMSLMTGEMFHLTIKEAY